MIREKTLTADLLPDITVITSILTSAFYEIAIPALAYPATVFTNDNPEAVMV